MSRAAPALAATDPRTVPSELPAAWQAKTRALFKAAIETGEYCVVSLEETSATGITATGNGTIDLGCGMITNSTSMSAAVASPGLIMKLEWSSENFAPPPVAQNSRPLQPASSTSFHELWPAGFLKVDPPVLLRSGWLSSRACAMQRVTLSKCACETSAPSPVATVICTMAPGTAMRRTESRSEMEKCRPTPNISRMTPSSASCEASPASATKPGVKGPKSAR